MNKQSSGHNNNNWEKIAQKNMVLFHDPFKKLLIEDLFVDDTSEEVRNHES